MIIPVVQIPIFISFFIGLRRMANLPIESMKTGGLLWFPDLTLSDPYFLLPILSSALMLLTIEVGQVMFTGSKILNHLPTHQSRTGHSFGVVPLSEKGGCS